MGWVEPEYLTHDRNVFWVRRDNYQLAAWPERSAAHLNQAGCSFIVHVLDDMAAKDTSKPSRRSFKELKAVGLLDGESVVA